MKWEPWKSVFAGVAIALVIIASIVLLVGLP